MLCYNRCATTSAFLVAGRKIKGGHWKSGTKGCGIGSRHWRTNPAARIPSTRERTPRRKSTWSCDWFAETPASVRVNRTPNCSTKSTLRNFVSLYRSNRILTSSPLLTPKNFSDFPNFFCDKGLTNLHFKKIRLPGLEVCGS